ncbi:MAG: hypothetical protein U9R72_11325 [Chloroflexota bacterium]|nr:hypothetical protein [Chloroflexota bacterium]
MLQSGGTNCDDTDGDGQSDPHMGMGPIVSTIWRCLKTLNARTAPEAQRFALEPPPQGADWPEVADDAEVIFVYEKEPHEPGARFYILLGYDAEETAMGWKRVEEGS